MTASSNISIAPDATQHRNRSVSVIISTTDRPELLRTALKSVRNQTAKNSIAEVVVSENAGSRRSAGICEEFTDLPLNYIYRDPPLPAVEHGRALYGYPESIRGEYVAILHDDDWWGHHHLEDGLYALTQDADAVAYWAASFLVHGEASWYMQCWNEASWVAAGFPPITGITKLDQTKAALACVGSGPAHYSTLIATKTALGESFQAVADSGNLHDNDRLLFLELSRRGPLLMDFVPQVFIRQHAAQDQRSLSWKTSCEQIASATEIVLAYCKERGIDVQREFDERYESCPIEKYRPCLTSTFDPRVIMHLREKGALPLSHLSERRRDAKWLAQLILPPMLWKLFGFGWRVVPTS